MTFLGTPDSGGSLYAIPGLDYVAHDDVLPYSTTDLNPIQNELFDKFFTYDKNFGRMIHKTYSINLNGNFYGEDTGLDICFYQSWRTILPLKQVSINAPPLGKTVIRTQILTVASRILYHCAIPLNMQASYMKI